MANPIINFLARQALPPHLKAHAKKSNRTKPEIPEQLWYDSYEAELNLRSQDRLLMRLVCLRTIVDRASLENSLDTDQITKEEAQKFNEVLERGIEKSRLMEFFSPKEKAGMQTPLGEMPPRFKIDFSWRIEALGVLMWAGSIIDEIPA